VHKICTSAVELHLNMLLAAVHIHRRFDEWFALLRFININGSKPLTA
jgi:hypothetical protein